MNAGQNNFPDAALRERADLLQDLLRISAADPASGIGNQAVGTELIAAVLNFDISPGVRGRLQLHGFEHRVLCQIRIGGAAQRLVSPVSRKISLDQLNDLSLFVVADQQVHCLVPLGLVPAGLRITADCHHQRLRILFPDTVKHLPAFAVGYSGDRTGVDNINIRLFREGNDFIPALPELLLHDIQFISVYLAAQVMQGSCVWFRHNFPRIHLTFRYAERSIKVSFTI